MATPPKVAFMETNTVVHSVDERKGCRSLLCDASGIIIAEMVYRCMVCYSIHDFIGDVSKHYHTVHMNDGDEETEDKTNEEEQDQSNRTNNSNLLAIDNNNNKRNSIHNQNNTKTTNTTSNTSNNFIDNNNNYLSDHSNNCDDPWETDEKFKSNSLSPVKSSSTSQSTNSSDITTTTNFQTNSFESCTRSGYIHCPVCSNVRRYTTLQRRYGQFTCVACYRFFKEFFLKPNRFSCQFLGQCPLDVKSKCKACWIAACSKIYSVDGRRKSILEAYAPVKSHGNQIISSLSSPCPSVIMNYHNENCKPLKSSNNTPSASMYSRPVDETRCSYNSTNLKESSNFGNDFSNNQLTCSGEFTSTDVNSNHSTNNSVGNVDNYINNHSELAGLSALNMLNILTCEEAVPDCDELLDGIADDYNSIDSQLNQFPPQKMIKLNDAQDINNNNNLMSDFNEQLSPQAQTNKQTATSTASFPTVKIEKSSVPTTTGTPTSVIKSKPDRRSKVRVKNWCCLKCANCLADDCGKCINCLDRPKFGGPFVRKQRCVNRKCLEKILPG